MCIRPRKKINKVYLSLRAGAKQEEKKVILKVLMLALRDGVFHFG